MSTWFLCYRCGAQNHLGNASCSNCGVMFQYNCPNCGSIITEADLLCPGCGNILSWSMRSKYVEAEDKRDGEVQQSRKRAWYIPLIGLIMVFAIASTGVYFLLKLNERPQTQLPINNVTSPKQDEMAISDKKPPSISGIEVINLSYNSVEIRWLTDEPSTTQVIWKTQDGNTDMTQQKEAPVKQHSVELINLKTKTTYYFKVRSVDQYGNEAISEERSFDIGKQPGTVRVEVLTHSMSVEEQPPPTGTRTYIRGQIMNAGDVALRPKDIELTINISVPGKPGAGPVPASLDPHPELINPGNTHKFVAVVPNGTEPTYTFSTKIINQ